MNMSQTIRERVAAIRAMTSSLADYATSLDALGDAKAHAEGTEERELAELRDEADLGIARALRNLESLVRFRAMTSRSFDLLIDATGRAQGNCQEALELMERFQTLNGDERDNSGEVLPESFPDLFLWDLYHRVSALNGLADRYPEHMRHAARQMHGWPMIVSHHLNHTGEFERIAEMLQIGASYPLDTSPRRKRGGPTPILDYLEPLVWRLDVVKKILADSEERRAKEDFSSRIKYFWWSPPDDPPTPEVLEILRRVPDMPTFSKGSAAEWSHQVIVPYIIATEGSYPEISTIPFIRNIMAHRAVKSASSFESRLHSAVTGFLDRYGRSD